MMISKIHPHFIYNTLNSVIVMARRGGNQEVVDMVRALILILQDGMAVHEDLLMDTIARERSVIKRMSQFKITAISEIQRRLRY